MRRAHVWTGNVTPQRVGVSSRRLSVLDRNTSELVNFDEGRAELAIRLLSTLSGSMQVLMFTHQERLAEIARALGEGRAHVVEL